MPYFAILFSILFLACEKPQPLDKDFALAYAELKIAEHEHGDTEEGKVVRFQILQKHNLDLNAFEEKIDKVRKKDADWVKFQRIVVDVLDSISKENKVVNESKEKKEIKENKEKRREQRELREKRKKREQP